MSCAAFIEANEPRLRQIVGVVAARYRLLWQDREDLFQETVTRLYASYDDIDSDGAVFAYTESIAGRLVLDGHRRALRRDQAWLARAHRHHAVEPTDPADAAIQRARVSSVRHALSRLPHRERRAVELAEFAELSTVDGAEAMQITPNAFKGLVQRGRQRLRLHLRDAPGVLPLGAVWRRRTPVGSAATSLVGVAAWCAVLIRPDIATLPHVTSLALAPVEAAHRVAVPLPGTATSTVTKPVPARDATAQAPVRSPRPSGLIPMAPQVCLPGTCVGHVRNGDELCVTDGQGQNMACAKQSQVAVCERVPDTQYATCTRDGNPDWIVPPLP